MLHVIRSSRPPNWIGSTSEDCTRLERGSRGRHVVGQIAEHDDEFVAADPDDGVLTGREGRTCAARRSAAARPGRMAETVVDVFEIVEVDISGDREAAETVGEPGRLGDAIFEQCATRQTGQRIVGRHEADTVLGALPLDRDAGHSLRRFDRPALGFGRRARVAAE